MLLSISIEEKNMQTKIIQPLWYHPTNVMLIDDDVNLLESLVMKVTDGAL